MYTVKLPPKRLGDVADGAELQVDLDAGGNGDGLDLALHDDGLVFVGPHGVRAHSVETAGSCVRVRRFERRGERVPAQARALDARGILAHARQGGELAEILRLPLHRP